MTKFHQFKLGMPSFDKQIQSPMLGTCECWEINSGKAHRKKRPQEKRAKQHNANKQRLLLLVQRLVLTNIDMEGSEAPRKEESRVIQPI